MTRPPESPWHVSLSTVVATSPLLGHVLEERAAIRERQDLTLSDEVSANAVVELPASQRASFVCAPVDVMVSRSPSGAPTFHILELNGTGIGGITNLPDHVVTAMTASLEEIADKIASDEAVILLAVSGKENDESPRHNRLMHEKLLFAEALCRGLQRQFARARVVAHVGTTPVLPSGPVVVIGYMKDLFGSMECDASGGFRYASRPVRAILNDRFCTNLADRMGGSFGFERTLPINACFIAGSDKGVAYELLEDFVRTHRPAGAPDNQAYETALDEDALEAAVVRRLRQHRKTVVKPRGTGIGHGIEFFLDPSSARTDIARAIRRSVALTSAYYGLPGGAFPYTVCDFIESCTITPGHPLAGHRFELRVVVYRDGGCLRAFPMAVKVAPARYDAAAPTSESLINNITASAERSGRGTDHLLPLANDETLDLVGLTRTDLRTLGSLTTRYVEHVLMRLHASPQRFGLTAAGSCKPDASARPWAAVALRGAGAGRIVADRRGTNMTTSAGAVRPSPREDI